MGWHQKALQRQKKIESLEDSINSYVTALDEYRAINKSLQYTVDRQSEEITKLKNELYKAKNMPSAIKGA